LCSAQTFRVPHIITYAGHALQTPHDSHTSQLALKAEIEARFPDWRFVGVGHGYDEHYLAADKIGTIPDRQYGNTPRMLLEAIEQRTEETSRMRGVKVQTGPHSA
jgi:hypothetical protein